MPYINPELRPEIDKKVDELVKFITVPGILTYVLTRIFHALLKNSSVRYRHLRDIVGDIEMAKMELYRVVAGPYENIKAFENGPVGVLTQESDELMRNATVIQVSKSEKTSDVRCPEE